jgi:hypothetical protein
VRWSSSTPGPSPRATDATTRLPLTQLILIEEGDGWASASPWGKARPPPPLTLLWAAVSWLQVGTQERPEEWGRPSGGRPRSPESRQGGGKVRGGRRCSGRPPRQQPPMTQRRRPARSWRFGRRQARFGLGGFPLTLWSVKWPWVVGRIQWWWKESNGD